MVRLMTVLAVGGLLDGSVSQDNSFVTCFDGTRLTCGDYYVINNKPPILKA